MRATYLSHSFSRHTHESFAIGVIVAGAEAFRCSGSLHIAPLGSIIVVNPAELHTGHSANPSGWSYRMLYPKVELLQQAASEIANKSKPVPYFRTPVIQDRQLAKCMSRLHADLETSNSTLEKDSCLLALLTQLVARHAIDRPAPSSLGRENRSINSVRDYLDAHYADDISLKILSSVANLSPFYLVRAFHAQVGLPPHAYLTQVRVRRAKDLLALGLAISQVALLTGFVDQSHLTQHFKRAVGVPPGHYAKGVYAA
ncbi:MAG: AraC family transcriptional regulator [Cyanobacteria bacterium P01_G01_bin.38]